MYCIFCIISALDYKVHCHWLVQFRAFSTFKPHRTNRSLRLNITVSQ